MSAETEACDRCGAVAGEPHQWTEGDCVLPHRRHSLNLLVGSFVCLPCVNRHREWLVEIVEMYATLTDVLLAGSLPDESSGEYEKPRKAPASPSPIRLQAWALLHTRFLNDHTVDEDGSTHAAYMGANLPNIPDVLTGWAQVAYDERGWTADAPDTVEGASAALRVAAEVMARSAMVDDYDAELRWVRNALCAAHGRSASAARPVGRCPSLNGDGSDCGGPLWPDQAGRMAVDCGRCGRHYDERFLSHLGGMLRAQ